MTILIIRQGKLGKVTNNETSRHSEDEFIILNLSGSAFSIVHKAGGGGGGGGGSEARIPKIKVNIYRLK